ncbi:hypothetical protein CR513_38039, partial [Mucuna pruriens]
MRKAPFKSREELNRLMRERFVPSYSTKDLYNKLQRSSVKVDSFRLSQSEVIVVDGQVSSTFTLANYVDKVMCDVVLVETTPIFLGRP